MRSFNEKTPRGDGSKPGSANSVKSFADNRKHKQAKKPRIPKSPGMRPSDPRLS